MRILMANTFHYLRGGDCTYTFGLTKLLQSKGHQVIPFAMHHPKNVHSSYSKYFVSYIDYVESLKSFGVATGLKVASRAVYSREAKRNIEELIRDIKPDIVHLQSIHGHLTPSILYAIKKRDIPVVWTLHDYKLICPNTSFLRDGEICERCKKLRYYFAPLSKCKKGSFVASLMACIEAYIHRLLRIEDLVDRFVTPSQFLKQKLVEYGFDESRIEHLPNFIDLEEFPYSFTQSDYFAYTGRLASEKGVDILIQAVSGIKGPRLIIAGDGPIREKLEELAKGSNGSHVEFLGHLQADKVYAVVRGAMFLAVPSKWYENCSYSILESFAAGKPVIGARIGGIPELIDDGVNGFLFEPSDVADLKEKIQYLWANPILADEMGRKAREKAEREYNSERYYEGIMSVYKRVIG